MKFNIEVDKSMVGHTLFAVGQQMPESVNVQVQTDEAHTKVVEDNWQQTMHGLEVSRKQ